MVGGTPKPFACTHQGCSMTFTNEDHLNVHQKKHEMDLDLSLGNKPNIFVADQTPTPTRFLRNCEEVGLFQDLQNVNPFEETFRRAVELVKTGSLPEPELQTDDTLHTPHVFPLLAEENNIYATQKCSELSVSMKLDTSEKLSSKDEFNKHHQDVFQTSKIHNITTENTKSEITKDHDYALELNKNTKTISKCNRAKLKLKQALKNRKKSLSVDINYEQSVPQTIYLAPINLEDSKIISTVPSLNTTVMPFVNTNVKYTSNIIHKNNVFNNNIKYKINLKDTKQDVLERNRAAAVRCREKRKKSINTLQNNYVEVCQHNKQLQEELRNLKNEVLQLKSLLLAHKDCPVTKAITGNQINAVPTQLIKVNIASQGANNKRLVLPKGHFQELHLQNIKIQKLNSTTKNISHVSTPVEKSVIVLNKNIDQK